MITTSSFSHTPAVRDTTVEGTFKYLLKQQAAGWPGSVSIKNRPLKASRIKVIDNG